MAPPGGPATADHPSCLPPQPATAAAARRSASTTRSCTAAAGTGATAATAATTRPGPAASAAGRTTTAGSLGPPASPATATPQVCGAPPGTETPLCTGNVWEGRVWPVLPSLGMSCCACPSAVVPLGFARLSSGMGWDSGKAQVGVYAPRNQCGHHCPSAHCPAGICAASRSYKADSPHPHHPKRVDPPYPGQAPHHSMRHRAWPRE